jgi:hypothetical protein
MHPGASFTSYLISFSFLFPEECWLTQGLFLSASANVESKERIFSQDLPGQMFVEMTC